MNIEDLKNLILESRINVSTIEGVRSNIPGSSAFVVRVSAMKQAQQIVSEWNNKIVQGSRIQIKIMEENFMDGAGDSGNNNFSQQSFQQTSASQYIPRNAVYPGQGNGNNGDGGRYPVENGGAIELPLRILIPNEFIGAIIGRGGNKRNI